MVMMMLMIKVMMTMMMMMMTNRSDSRDLLDTIHSPQLTGPISFHSSISTRLSELTQTEEGELYIYSGECLTFPWEGNN